MSSERRFPLSRLTTPYLVVLELLRRHHYRRFFATGSERHLRQAKLIGRKLDEALRGGDK